MTQADGSSRCGESPWLFLLGLYQLVKISIEEKRKEGIIELTGKHFLEKVQEFLSIHNDDCEVKCLRYFGSGMLLFSASKISRLFAPRLEYEQPKIIQTSISKG